MGFLDALTADASPRDSQGRRVFAPWGRRGKAYILPADRARQVAFVQRRLFQMYVAVLVVAIIAVGPWGILAVSVVWIAASLGGTAYLTRGLEEATERPSLAREERVAIAARAMGRPTMYVVCFLGVATAGGGMWLLRRGQGGMSAWFLVIYGTLVAVLYAWRLVKSPPVALSQRETRE